MKVVRLLVLGMLSQHGPMHGHQLKLTIQTIDIEAWSEVRAGSLYHALHQLAVEGLIEQAKTERPGRQPARTVYRITPAGEAELQALRERALRVVQPPADPFDIALWVAAGLPASVLEDAVRERLATLRRQLRDVAAERGELLERGVLPEVGSILMRHAETRLDAEIRWHEELLAVVPALRPGGPQGEQAQD
ncbi:MAG TPA: PadR family transcriptional regulator [Candidatus Dormibacteraeota bacterium]|jgi:DNA-binding PadR family transcriptional regulator